MGFALLTAVMVGWSLVSWLHEYHLRSWQSYEISGDLARMNGGLEDGEKFYRAALAEAQKVGDKQRTATTSRELARLENIRNAPGVSSSSGNGNYQDGAWIWKSALEYQTMIKRNRSQRRWSVALKPLFEREIMSAKSSPENLVRLADSQVEMTNLGLAKQLYELAGTVNQETGSQSIEVKLLERFARVAFAQQHYEIALQYLDRALAKTGSQTKLNSAEMFLLLNKVQVYADTSDGRRGAALCERLAKMPNFLANPKRNWYYSILVGQCQSRMGHHKEALQLLNKAAQAAPALFGESSSNVERSYETLAEALIMAGRPTDAYPLFEKVFSMRNRRSKRNTSVNRLIVDEEARYLILKRQDVADALCTWFVERRAKAVGSKFRRNKCLLFHLSQVYGETGDREKSKQFQAQAEAIH